MVRPFFVTATKKGQKENAPATSSAPSPLHPPVAGPRQLVVCCLSLHQLKNCREAAGGSAGSRSWSDTAEGRGYPEKGNRRFPISMFTTLCSREVPCEAQYFAPFEERDEALGMLLVQLSAWWRQHLPEHASHRDRAEARHRPGNSLVRRYSIRRFSYGYLVTTYSQSAVSPWYLPIKVKVLRVPLPSMS